MSVNDLVKLEFYVSNRDRNASEGPFDWTVTFPQGMAEMSATSFFLQIDSVYLINFIPTIMQGINDTFTYEYTPPGGSPSRFSLVFSQGVYDINDIINTLLAELQTRNAGFNLIFDSKQLKLSVFVPANCVFSIVRPLSNPYVQPNFRYANANDRFLEILGWSFNQNASFSIAAGGAGTTWTPPNPVRMDGSMMLHLNIGSSIQAYTTGSKGFRPLACFPLTAGYGSLVTSSSFLQNTFEINSLDIQNGLRFFISDEWGVPLNNFVPFNTPVHVRFSLRPPQ